MSVDTAPRNRLKVHNALLTVVLHD
jgi:hypothetical protein